ncbi:hypothetical protein DPMN_001472 [Dreissena polymorpha]|uniref:Uncharacterized protein n=1 Tax=Dreissena polymorpha TaxID=45954 RepID=A0A9D4MHC2_DREPO|nr:hypothetical protein DPMN_001472 [Dreissena polymorpha]
MMLGCLHVFYDQLQVVGEKKSAAKFDPSPLKEQDEGKRNEYQAGSAGVRNTNNRTLHCQFQGWVR